MPLLGILEQRQATADDGATSKEKAVSEVGRAVDYNDERFNQFWAAYPRKVGKYAAFQEWRRRKAGDVFDTIMAALEKHKRCDQWSRGDGMFIPHPSTWLRDKRWEDVVKIRVPEPAGSLKTLDGVGRPMPSEADVNFMRACHGLGFLRGYRKAMDDLLAAGMLRDNPWGELIRLYEAQRAEYALPMAGTAQGGNP